MVKGSPTTTNIHPALLNLGLEEFLALPAHAGIPVGLLGLMIAEVMGCDTPDAKRLMAALSPAQCSAIEEWRSIQPCNRCGSAAGLKCWHTFELTGEGFINTLTCRQCLGRPQ
jgi:hypothetical protein